MALQPGTRLGPYEILALAGAGGMGEVYRARDTRLGRIVAIKVIGSAFGDSAEIRRRFEEEGRFVAQLDHPRIAAVYDVGHHAGVDYLVMEFLEGKSLAARIGDTNGPLPFGDLIGYAIEIASGLAYAHVRGVVHRDLKPGNVLLTPTGIKIIDFGLGKLRQEQRRPSDNIAALKTTPMPMTEPGVVPGTAQYMPPERLEGLEADYRSDIFAFGAIVYEMATGRRAFDAATPAALIAAILTTEPPVIDDGHGPMSDLEWVVRRCLRKNPDERWQSMTDVEVILKRIASTSARPRASDDRRRGRMGRGRLIATGVATLVAVGGLAVAAIVSHRPVRAESPIAFTIPPPDDGGFTPTESSAQSPQLAVSPDGRLLAFVASGADGVQQLWIRSVDMPTARPVPGTARATYPFWSPRSRSLGFFADGYLKRIDLDGGPARNLAPAPNGRGGAWNTDDVILFCPGTSSSIHRVAANGTSVEQTKLDPARREMSHRWPQFLPDGRHFIFLARTTDEAKSGIFLGSLDSHDLTFIVPTGFGALYVPTGQGYLLYVADEALLAVSFDPAHPRISGDPLPIVDDIATSSSFYGAFSISAGDVLAYSTKAGFAELAWFARDGRRLGTAVPRGNYVDFQISPDGRNLAVAEIEPHVAFPDLRLVDLLRGTNLRLTTSPATDASPVWSPDSSRLIFRSNRDREHDLYVRSANGGGDDAPFLKTATAKYPTDWSSDGRLVVYHTFDDRTRFDIWAAPVENPNEPRPLVRTPWDEMQGQISPNAQWLAYTSNMSSRNEVYVEPTAHNGRKWQISVDGGSNPKWRADSHELFYLAADNRLMSVDIGGGSELNPGPARPLFPLSGVSVTRPFLSRWFDVDPKGDRFLVRVPTDSVQSLPLNVLVHWSPDRRVSQ